MLFAAALRSKKPGEEAEALRHMFTARGTPREVHGDAEFEAGPVRALLDDRHVAFVLQAKGDYNATATLGSAIQQLRAELARRMLAQGAREWEPLLQAAVTSQNTLSRPHLGNHSALDAWAAASPGGHDPTLEFQLREQAAEDRDYNEHLRDDRAQRLQRDGGFRVAAGQQKSGFRRGFKPVWGGHVHSVEAITPDGFVKDEQGHEYATRLVLPVPKESGDVDLEAAGRARGSEAVDRARLARYEPFRERLQAFVAARGGRVHLALLIKHARQELKMELPQRSPSPKEVMELLGFRVYAEAPGSSTYWVESTAPA
jgi:hypothetical protein